MIQSQYRHSGGSREVEIEFLKNFIYETRVLFEMINECKKRMEIRYWKPPGCHSSFRKETAEKSDLERMFQVKIRSCRKTLVFMGAS